MEQNKELSFEEQLVSLVEKHSRDEFSLSYDAVLARYIRATLVNYRKALTDRDIIMEMANNTSANNG